MNTILSPYTASVSELKKNPNQLLELSNGEPIAILNHNRPTAYLLPASTYEELLEELDDLKLAKIIKERESEKKLAKSVSLDEFERV